MRFDDSLETVLTADMSTPFGAQTAWRQLVDLIGRRRAPPSPAALARLRSIRPQVPSTVRAASGRALAFAKPPAALVRLFAEEDLSISAPVLRMADLTTAEWLALLPDMSPSGRSVLRHRRDLGDDVLRALESYGPIDFILPPAEQEAVETQESVPDEAAATPAGGSTPETAALPVLMQPVAEEGEGESVLAVDWTAVEAAPDMAIAVSMPPAESIDAPPLPTESIVAEPLPEPLAIDWTQVMRAWPATPISLPVPAPAPLAEPSPAVIASVPTAAASAEPAADVALSPDAIPEPTSDSTPDSTFVSLASVALGLPVVAAALRRHEAEALAPADAAMPESELPSALEAPDTAAPALVETPDGEASGPFKISDLVARIDAYQRQREEGLGEPTPVITNDPAIAPAAPPRDFQFETDANGHVRWVAGVSRGSLVGMSLDMAVTGAGTGVDGAVAGAFRRRASFANARLLVAGGSDAAGQWRISGVPVFDRQSGRFTGYRGTARRPRMDECAEFGRGVRSPATDSLRQLVHELRTPTTAIAGFAEMIEGELLGPVPSAYRDYAGTIRSEASDLLAAIDDLDVAARIEAHALDLRPVSIAVAPLLSGICADLQPLAEMRGARFALAAGSADVAVHGDDRAVERLVGRLLAALTSAAGQNETLKVEATIEGEETVAIHIDRPIAMAAFAGEALLSIDSEAEWEGEGAPLLGTGFALRLARNLAAELGGSLTIGRDRLTLRLPAAFTQTVEQASTF